AFDDLEIHVGGAQGQLPRTGGGAFGAQQHVRENRDCRTPFDDALHMAERLKEGGPFDGKLHGWRTKVADRKETRPPRSASRTRHCRRDSIIAWKGCPPPAFGTRPGAAPIARV